MKEKILNEITESCDNCKVKDCCKEDECVLYRIEQIVLDKKNIYKIEISENICRIIEVEATSEKEAIDIVEQKYKNAEIVLDASDYVEYEIKRFGGNE